MTDPESGSFGRNKRVSGHTLRRVTDPAHGTPCVWMCSKLAVYIAKKLCLKVIKKTDFLEEHGVFVVLRFR